MRTQLPGCALQDATEVLFTRNMLEDAHSPMAACLPLAAALLWGAGLRCWAGALLSLRSGRLCCLSVLQARMDLGTGWRWAGVEKPFVVLYEGD